MPPETLSASREIVPVGAVEVGSALRMTPGGDPVPDIVGQGAYCLAGKVGLPVEQREAPLLDGQVAGSAVGSVADELGPSLGLGGRCGRSVAQAGHDQCVGEASDTETDAAFRECLPALLLQREAGNVDRVAHYAHRKAHSP